MVFGDDRVDVDFEVDRLLVGHVPEGAVRVVLQVGQEHLIEIDGHHAGLDLR